MVPTAICRTRIRFVDEKTVLFSMFVTMPNGEEMKNADFTYRKK